MISRNTKEELSKIGYRKISLSIQQMFLFSTCILDREQMLAERRTEDISDSLRSLLLVAILTPMMLIPEPVWESTSVETSVAMVAVGALSGVGTELLLRVSDADPQSVSESVSLAVALTSSVIVTGLLWILLPYGLFREVPRLFLGFAWGFSLVPVVQRVWLTVAG